MNNNNMIQEHLRKEKYTWLVTGVAGFIGSHLAGNLLLSGQKIIGLDNLSTGTLSNIVPFKDHSNFTFIEGDIRDQKQCLDTCENVDYILHHAAIGSVAKSIEDPTLTDQVNNGGFINILLAARQQNIKNIVYASSSAIYGDKDEATKRHESELPEPMSPYAASKCANEKYAQSLENSHGITSVGLRYFNIYGSRQDPNGAYAAVIPKWIDSMLNGQDIDIFGDGETTRDFCHINDVVQANIAAALCDTEQLKSPVYNIAAGQGTTLNELFSYLKENTDYKKKPTYEPFRNGDIKISHADITHAQNDLGFTPSMSLANGLKQTAEWYRQQLNDR